MGVLLYGLDMPAKKRPTPRDAVTLRQILLDGLARETGIGELIAELAPWPRQLQNDADSARMTIALDGPLFCRQNVLFWLVLGAGQAGGR